MIYVDELRKFSTDIDNPRARRHAVRNDGWWCRMVADTHGELMEFAESIGLKSGWLQKRGDREEHFSLTPGMRVKAVRHGASELDWVYRITRKKDRMKKYYEDSD